jgi:hypothetical protein
MAVDDKAIDYVISDQAASEWLLMISSPGALTKLAGAVKLILETSGYGEITIQVRDGKIYGRPKATVSIG